MGDYASLTLMPFTGPVCRSLETQASGWDLSDATLQPDFIAVKLLRYGLEMNFAPSRRGGLLHMVSKHDEEIRLRLNFEGEYDLIPEQNGTGLILHTRNNAGGCPPGFGLWVRLESSLAWDRIELCDEGCVLHFPAHARSISVGMGSSFIDSETAVLALQREVAKQTIEELSAQCREEWNILLQRIQVPPEQEFHRDMIYSCLYRCLLFPRRLDELNAHGLVVHRSPYNGQVGEGPLCTDHGFWDAYRTVYPLLGLLYPDHLSAIMEGWVQACRQAAWAPKWASPGLRDCMIGTHFDAVAADAIARGVTDWSIRDAFTYIWKGATVPSSEKICGREGLELYLKHGYVPSDREQYSVCVTLDYAYGDFCGACVARHLGLSEEAGQLEARALNYRNVFDQETGFMRGRRSDGSWEPFHEFRWRGGYIEGGPWQHRFHVPHNPQGLAGLMGGSSAVCHELERMMSTPPRYEDGGYGCEIHEMTEMALAGFGQYAHSNQPVHAFLFLFSLMGKPERTDYWVHRIAGELYSIKNFPGDEDNGEMCAWYIFACLGIYPVCPGVPGWLHFKPFVPGLKISSAEGAEPIAPASLPDMSW